MKRSTAVAASAGLLLTGLTGYAVPAAVAGSASPVPAQVPGVSTVLVSTPTDLGTLGGDESWARDVDGNLVVGYAQTATGRVHAFAYDLAAPDSRMLDLGTLGGPDSFATNVDGDVVVGYSETPDGTRHAFAYDLGSAHPTMVDLGTLEGRSTSAATDVSGSVVVGWSAPGWEGETRHAFAYDLATPSPTLRDLGLFRGKNPLSGMSSASAVDGNLVVGRAGAAYGLQKAFVLDLADPSGALLNLGKLKLDSQGGGSDAAAIDGSVVAGTWRNRTMGSQPFTYDVDAPEAGLRALGTLGGKRASPTAISGDVVVGTSTTTSRDERAFAFDLDDPAAQMLDLGSLGGDSAASAVSGDVVVGTAETPAGEHAFAYDLAVPGMHDLGTLGGASSVARAIDGRVVTGWSQTADGLTHATAWTLTPTSATAFSFGETTYSATEQQPEVTVSVERSGDLTATDHVTLRALSMPGAAPSEDLAPDETTVEFGPGETTRTVTLAILDDDLAESTESTLLRLDDPSAGTVAGSPRFAEVVLSESDQRPDLTVSATRHRPFFLGEDIYVAGPEQTVRAEGQIGKEHWFLVAVRVDPVSSAAGPFEGTVTLHGTRPPAGAKVQYNASNWGDVTRTMFSEAGYVTTTSSAGRQVFMRVGVRLSPTAPVGSRHPVEVYAEWSGGEGSYTDSVRMVLIARRS